MKFYRIGHLKLVVSLKVGDTVRAGDRIGDNSTGNGQWAAHAHFDILTYQPSVWTEYVIGWSLDKVKSHYADPRGLEKKVLPTFDHLGYGWLENAQYSGGHAFHPGLDLNGSGSGNADEGDPIFSPCTGVIRYVYHGTGTNSGWGGLIVIEEKAVEPANSTEPKAEEFMKKEFVDAIEKLVGKDYGENLNESEQLDAAKQINEKRTELIEHEQSITTLNAAVKSKDATVVSLQSEVKSLQISLDEKSKEIDILIEKVGTLTKEIETLKKKPSTTVNPTTQTKSLWETLLEIFGGKK